MFYLLNKKVIGIIMNNENNAVVEIKETQFDWNLGCFITAWGRPLTLEEESRVCKKTSLSEMAMEGQA